MDLKDMIEVMQAAERGEAIEMRYHCQVPEIYWHEFNGTWKFDSRDYRIAPKKQKLSLVEEIYQLADSNIVGTSSREMLNRAAYRIKELEGAGKMALYNEIKLRAK